MSSHKEDSAESTVFAVFAEIREEATNLSLFMGKVVDAAEKQDADSTSVKAAKRRAQNVMTANTADMDSRLKELKETLATVPNVRKDWGDSEARLHNLWQQSQEEWTDRDSGTSGYKGTKEALDTLALEAAYVEIPQRIRENLGDIRVG